ncbi:MAG: hypothetical protein DRP00_00175 [Candidatus Aenigmatarchaeota archaeon]|nr:MAG: hypothetical protein DRO30_00160 [Candidatus Bathyarchaeota archaeon]RLI99092.1 MAG: hypothetical protein DRP00_00175 [Candidatus Aenigmarchaeota archaeon]
MSFEEENNQLIKSFLERTFFKGFRDPEKYPNWSRVELYVNAKCNQQCKYCYLARYGKYLYPEADSRRIYKNTLMLLDWLDSNKFRPHFELFSGEPLIQDVCHKIIGELIKRRSRSIVIPTNFTFVLYPKIEKEVLSLISKAKASDVKLLLSASIDGKYCEANRPIKGYKVDPRDDKFYDRVFTICSKFGYGFHPMVYSELIENWRDNFLWFQSMFKKHNIPWWNLYLLEVRNVEWSRKQIYHLGEFIKFLLDWSYKKTRGNLLDFILRMKGFNILSNPVTRVGRGIGCSIQSVMNVRLHDLAIFPCHRTSYPQFKLGEFEVKDKRIIRVRAVNPDLWIAILTFDANTFPYCEQCPVKYLCGKGCLGSQYEVTGDLFTPIPTVCEMEHWKLYCYVEKMKDLGLLDALKSLVTPEKRSSIEFLEGEIKK